MWLNELDFCVYLARVVPQFFQGKTTECRWPVLAPLGYSPPQLTHDITFIRLLHNKHSCDQQGAELARSLPSS
jgi:hypothetical protein